jgi:predicted ATPase
MDANSNGAASHLFIVTGGPGAGKTTLINSLHDAGFAISVQAGRAIAQDQTMIGGSAVPWLRSSIFNELVLSWGIRSYREALTSDRDVFFDQAIPCVSGYIRAQGLPVPAHFGAAVAAFRYSPTVFIAPPWREIYRQDTERWETFEQAEIVYESLAQTYREYGYHLVSLPRSSVEDRRRFVLSHMRTAHHG